MTWKKHFQSPSATRRFQAFRKQAENDPTTSAHLNAYSSRFASWLPDVYVGQPNRIERYSQYDNMDLDTEVSNALDTMADSCTSQDGDSGLPFEFEYLGNVTEEEVVILQDMLRKWYEINEWEMRLWRLFRSALKYGDQFLIRDPETYKLFWVDHSKVESVIVDEAKGKRPEQYVIRDLDLNLQTLVATGNLPRPSDQRGYSSGPLSSGHFGGSQLGQKGQAGSRFDRDGGAGAAGLSHYVNGDHVVHMGLSEGMDNVWPFGTSILESVFKAFKKKELIEDAVVIYRVQRAPERRVFYVDTGRLPTHKAHAYLERVKNEIQQKRIPSRTGGDSNVLDATYNPMCLDFSTKIPLLDGRTLELSEIIKEYESGKENWVYSCDEITGKIKPGNITWAGKTKENAESIKLTFDNGKTLICTPDHKIPVLGKGFVEAQQITTDDSLISYETDYKSLSGDKNRSYQRVYDHEMNKWVFTHRMVSEFFKDIGKHQVFTFDESLLEYEKNTVHHKDYNRYNNDPSNLTWMNFEDHRLYHSFVKQEYWENLTEEESIRIKEKIRAGLKKYRENNPLWKEEHYKDHSLKIINALDSRTDDEKSTQYKNCGIARGQYLKNNTEAMNTFIENGKLILSKKRAKNQTLNFTQGMLSRLVTIVKDNNSNRVETIQLANADKKLMTLLKEANPICSKSTQNVDNETFTNSKLKKMYSVYGYDGWKDFKQKTVVYNHKVVSIEKVENRNVGTITVDFNERWHNHHTFAIDAGIFIKNSMLEDYFFAQNSDGKGSRVETLPGGDQLGEIDDLKYFNHQMRIGLRIPRSYLPDANDGGGALFSDGRIGTAYIEEYRYSRYCERLQTLIMPPLDNEFKLFCKHRGIKIHSALYNLRLIKPQNFSKYREIEMDSAVLSVYSQVADIPHISRRFGLMKYAGWGEGDILKNERMWAEENPGAAGPFAKGEMGSNFGDVGASSAGLEQSEELGGEEGADLGDDGLEGTASPISGDERGAEPAADEGELEI